MPDLRSKRTASQTGTAAMTGKGRLQQEWSGWGWHSRQPHGTETENRESPEICVCRYKEDLTTAIQESTGVQQVVWRPSVRELEKEGWEAVEQKVRARRISFLYCCLLVLA